VYKIKNPTTSSTPAIFLSHFMLAANAPTQKVRQPALPDKVAGQLNAVRTAYKTAGV